MGLSLKAELRTTQSLVMTPQLMQAIKLLQLSSLDLAAYVDAELERNPLLERADAEDLAPTAADLEPPVVEAPPDDGSWFETELETSPAAISDRLDTDLSNVFPDDNTRAQQETPPTLPADTWANGPTRQPVSADDYNLEAFVADSKTLPEFLAEQLGLATNDHARRLVGMTLIAELDEAGYMRTEIGELARRLGASEAVVAETLCLLKTFEPTGVFAANLAECLALQLKELNR